MAAAGQTSSGGGWFAKLVVVGLLALAIGLYLRIVMVDRDPKGSAQVQQASMRIVESAETGMQPSAALGTSAVRRLPEDQLQVILRVFAPEMQN